MQIIIMTILIKWCLLVYLVCIVQCFKSDSVWLCILWCDFVRNVVSSVGVVLCKHVK